MAQHNTLENVVADLEEMTRKLDTLEQYAEQCKLLKSTIKALQRQVVTVQGTTTKTIQAHDFVWRAPRTTSLESVLGDVGRTRMQSENLHRQTQLQRTELAQLDLDLQLLTALRNDIDAVDDIEVSRDTLRHRLAALTARQFKIEDSSSEALHLKHYTVVTFNLNALLTQLSAATKTTAPPRTVARMRNTLANTLFPLAQHYYDDDDEQEEEGLIRFESFIAQVRDADSDVAANEVLLRAVGTLFDVAVLIFNSLGQCWRTLFEPKGVSDPPHILLYMHMPTTSRPVYDLILTKTPPRNTSPLLHGNLTTLKMTQKQCSSS